MIEPNNIYHADCVNIMRDMDSQSVDLVLTDAPYECDKGGGANCEMGKSGRLPKFRIAHLISGFDYDKVFNEFLRICKVPNILIFCSNNQITKTMGWFEERGLRVTLLVWHKTNPIPLANMQHLQDVEFIVYVRDKGATFNADMPIDFKKKVFTSGLTNTMDKSYGHPTQKPLLLLRRYILLHSKENDVIFDPFMGSGSTCVAAIKEKRRYIGVELEEEYFEIAKKRIDNEKAQLTLF